MINMKKTKETLSHRLCNNWQILQNYNDLTLIGMRGDTFISLSFLDQILSAELFIKNFQTFLEVKKIDKLPSSSSLIKVAPICTKGEHFLCFHSSCQWGFMTVSDKTIQCEFLVNACLTIACWLLEESLATALYDCLLILEWLPKDCHRLL